MQSQSLTCVHFVHGDNNALQVWMAEGTMKAYTKVCTGYTNMLTCKYWFRYMNKIMQKCW